MDHSMEAGNNNKQDYNAKAKPQDFLEGDQAYLDNQLFLGKNEKFAQRWIGPYLIIKVINDQNIELQVSPKRRQIPSAYTLKKFIDPRNQKILMRKILKVICQRNRTEK
jgi:hypothetical protein